MECDNSDKVISTVTDTWKSQYHWQICYCNPKTLLFLYSACSSFIIYFFSNFTISLIWKERRKRFSNSGNTKSWLAFTKRFNEANARDWSSTSHKYLCFVLSHVSCFRLSRLQIRTLADSCLSFLPQGAPIVVSFPHFYQADPKYINAVDGLNPNKEEHETYLDLQPVRQNFCPSRLHWSA